MKELMFLLLFIGLFIAAIVVFVSIIRWALLLNKIVDLLQEISGKISPIPSKPQTVHGKCDKCCNWFFVENLTTTKDNKMFCPDCAKTL